MGTEIIGSPAARGLERRDGPRQESSPRRTRTGSTRTSTATRRTRRRTTSRPAEIWHDVPEITHFIAGLGTAGTIIGVGTFLKERNPDIEIWAIEPPVGEMVDGLKNFDEGFVPPVFIDGNGADLLSRKMIVRPRESIEWVRRFAEVGVFAGISSGAIMAGAAKAAMEIDEGTIVMIVCDGGWKYLSTGAWTDDLDVVEEPSEEHSGDASCTRSVTYCWPALPGIGRLARFSADATLPSDG